MKRPTRNSRIPALAAGLAAALTLACSESTEPSPAVEGSGLIRGAVVGFDGLPVRDAVVRLHPRHGSYSLEPVEGVRTDAEGRYEIRMETPDLDQPSFRGDIGVSTTASSIYFRDTLVYSVPLRFAEATATTVLDVAVDGCATCD